MGEPLSSGAWNCRTAWPSATETTFGVDGRSGLPRTVALIVAWTLRLSSPEASATVTSTVTVPTWSAAGVTVTAPSIDDGAPALPPVTAAAATRSGPASGLDAPDRTFTVDDLPCTASSIVWLGTVASGAVVPVTVTVMVAGTVWFALSFPVTPSGTVVPRGTSTAAVTVSSAPDRDPVIPSVAPVGSANFNDLACASSEVLTKGRRSIDADVPASTDSGADANSGAGITFGLTVAGILTLTGLLLPSVTVTVRLADPPASSGTTQVTRASSLRVRAPTVAETAAPAGTVTCRPA